MIVIFNWLIFLIILISTFSFTQTTKLHDYEELITKFSQLQQAVGNDANEISVAVSQVSTGIKETLDKYNSLQDGFKDKCDAGNLLLNEFIAKLNNDNLALVAQVSLAQDSIKSAEKQNADFKEVIRGIKSDIEAKETDYANQIAEFEQYAVEADAKIISVKSITDIIVDELLNQSTGAVSFLQLNTKEFKMKIQDLKAMLLETKAKETKYSPMAMTLLQLAMTKGFSDQAVLRQVLDILKKISDNLVTFREKQQSEGKSQLKSMRAAIDEKKNQAKANYKLYQTAKGEISANQELIQDANKNKVSIDATILRKTAEIGFWSKLCNYESDAREAAIKSSRDFSDLLNKVITRLTDL